MKLRQGGNLKATGSSCRGFSQGQRGYITLVVFTLMILMLGIVMQTGLLLRGLRQELRLLETRQVRRYSPAGAAAKSAAVQVNSTNRVHPVSYGQSQRH